MNDEVKRQLELIKKGIDEILPEKEFIEKIEKSLKENIPMKIKLGADPTAPDLHLGHWIVLKKLRDFQELGHKVIFIIGDFTAMIGDPSGRSQTRPALSVEEIKKNAETYKDQVFKVLIKDKTDIVFNSEWLSKLSFADAIKLSASTTVARMLERDDFNKRYKEGTPISVHEFMYPLLQGWDSVVIESDIEVGGTDQKFNLLVGRELQEKNNQPPQVILTMPLLIGTDGTKKMSKSYGNYIAFNDKPKDIFGKVMSVSDELMWEYYRLVMRLGDKEISDLKERVKTGNLHPKKAKIDLALYITEIFHNKEEALNAQKEFENIFVKRDIPEDIEEYELSEEKINLLKLLKDSSMIPSNSEGKRLLIAGAVKINGDAVKENTEIKFKDGDIVKVGKRRFLKIIRK